MIKKTIVGTIRITAGIILVLVGLFALVTPLTPGSWLAIIGLQLLGLGFIWHDWIKPHLQKWLRKRDK